MANWLTLKTAALLTKAPAKTPASVPATSAEFDRKVAAFRKAAGIIDTCRIPFFCAKFRQPFEVAFERPSPSDRFTITSIDRVMAGTAAAGKTPGLRNFNIDEFSLGNWYCAGCSARNFIRCEPCGVHYCNASAREVGDGSDYSECPCCGRGGWLTPLRKMSASDSCGRSAGPHGLAGADRTRLARPQNAPLLPGRRR